MEVLNSLLPNFGQMFYYSFLFVAKGGWILFVLALLFMLWHEYLEEIQGHFVANTEWVFLEIRPPKENMVSTLAVENIFSQMHALHRSLTWDEVYMQGQFQLWYSLEIVSFGGKVSFIIRCPKRYQHLVESAFYGQYPNSEIREVADYMANFTQNVYAIDNKYEFFGTEWRLAESDVIPIKTYKDFEHPSAEEKVIDPLKGLIEAMERILPHEFMAMQLLIQPIQNDEWSGKAKTKIKELTGEEVPHKASFMGFLLAPFEWFAKFSYSETLFGHHHHAEPENKPRNNWLNMSEGEKKRVTLIEEKLNKANYQSKLRILYIAPKELYDKIRRFEIVGALRHFSPGGGAGIQNTLKTDRGTWTKVDALFSEGLERPYLEWETKRRKHLFLKGYKARSVYIGSKKFLLSTEEIASLYHFPITNETTQVPANVQAVESKKSRPPADLPFADV
ncbi:MAG: hypothetical protein P4L74_05135 [Candidatus Doudnabacteria bacterium]|nr:hypothetical protein [Candidatus Doudnabacteria bacterium]